MVCIHNSFLRKAGCAFTASASGVKAHEALQLVMKTICADVREETQLLVQGVKGKVNSDGEIIDVNAAKQLKDLAVAFIIQLNEKREQLIRNE